MLNEINFKLVDSRATTHISVTMQGCSDDNKVIVEAIRTFRLQLKTEFHLDLSRTLVLPFFRRKFNFHFYVKQI
ncbi:hypothetical protein CR513_34380, partial [Mucuna pruriens]